MRRGRAGRRIGSNTRCAGLRVRMGAVAARGLARRCRMSAGGACCPERKRPCALDVQRASGRPYGKALGDARAGARGRLLPCIDAAYHAQRSSEWLAINCREPGERRVRGNDISVKLAPPSTGLFDMQSAPPHYAMRGSAYVCAEYYLRNSSMTGTITLGFTGGSSSIS